MRKKEYKGRCEKRILQKCNTVFKSYSPIQSAYANILVKNKDIAEIQCNVPLDGEVCEEYMSDFLCVMQSGDMIVRECVSRAHITKPMTVKMLDMSRTYWLRHGVSDWGIVVDAAEE